MLDARCSGPARLADSVVGTWWSVIKTVLVREEKGPRFIYLATHATPVGSLGDAVTGLKTVTGDK